MSHADLIAQVRAGIHRAPLSPRTILHLADALEEAERQLSAIRAQANDWLANWPEGANAARDLLALMDSEGAHGGE